LFTLPIFKQAFPPDGIPLYSFGAMLFVAFISALVWGSVRAKRIGMPATRFQDFMIVLLISGIIGARVVYMIQYSDQFRYHSIAGLALAFFKIWEGGIVFYGSVLGGVIGFGLFYWFVMRRLAVHVSGWQLADAVAPLLAMGLAIGRIGCYLNGCCWGQVANEEACAVPLGAAHFPLLPAHARDQLVGQSKNVPYGYLQSSTGFAIVTDPRPRVVAVEVASPAEKAGVKVGDRIVKINGADIDPVNVLDEVTSPRNWPRGKGELRLTVERDGAPVTLPAFVPLTVGLYPTQLYETMSMVLLILVLVAYYPYRRHDGQLMVVVMLGYAVHRFINESLRIEPAYAGGLTLSQWGSVAILAVAVALEVYLWRVMPSRWKGEPQSVAALATSQGSKES
jgi:prolipoprotein diacylglyceryl transferase